MRCSYCSQKAVAFLPHTRKAYCKKHFIHYYERKVKRLVPKILDQKNDFVGVGISGGKDSLVMLHLLHSLRFNVIPIIVDEGIKGYRNRTIPYAEKMCKHLGLELHKVSFKEAYGKTLDQMVKEGGRNACSYCGVFRRDLLNRKARELGCTKLAIGHNLDDEVQSILMNFFRGELNRLARGGPVTGIVQDKRFIPRVKPLRECSEKENVIYALLKGIEYSDIECPYAVTAYRGTVRDAVNLVEAKYPGTKLSILHTNDKLIPILRKNIKATGPLDYCEVCGEPSAERICKACQFKKEF